MICRHDLSSQVSLEEFLESCRATSLLAEFEDDEELPDADGDDDDNDDDDNDEDDDFEDNLDEESFEAVGIVTRNMSMGRRKVWDDEHVLRRKFSALIPAFDPRPGRNNVNQTSDLVINEPGSVPEDQRESPIREASPQPKLHLTLRGPNLPGVPDIEIDLSESDWTIFRAVQFIVQNSNLGSKSEKIRRVWEPTYVITYKEARDGAEGAAGLDDLESLGGRRSSGPSSTVLPQLPVLNQAQCSMDEVLQLLRQLYIISTSSERLHKSDTIPGETYQSKKITNKLVQQIQDPLVLSANAMPDWCHELTFSCPMLFPFDTRLLYFQCTAFGASRSIVWLQNQRDQNSERTRGGLARGREELHEFRVGRIKHERVKVPRGENLLDWAIQVMKVHADRKAILEVEFLDEEGTGLGPTLEFFALVAAELQRKDLAMWICDDQLTNQEEIDMGEGKKPPGFYVIRPSGLFPAPLAQDSEICEKVSKLFWFLGVFLAKALQDNRLVDIPLSYPMLKLLCQGEVSTIVKEKSRIIQAQNQEEDELMTSSMYSILSEESDLDTSGGQASEAKSWFSHLLGLDDLTEVDRQRGNFLKTLQDLVVKKQAITSRLDLTEDEKMALLDKLTLAYEDHEVSLEDLCLTFQFSPSSSVFGFHHVDLITNGEHEVVTIHNVEDYIDLMMDFTLRKGIRKQLESFRAGFNQVFPIDKLGAFSPDEIKMMLCGDQCPVFTKDDIIKYTEPKLGYSRDSPAFLKFVNVLVNFNALERKAFLQFTTGCSSLPPGMY